MTAERDLDDVTQGDTKTYTYTFSDGSDEPYDITDWTLYFTVRPDYGETPVITKDVTTHTAPTDGETEVKLTSTDTDIEAGSYVYDVQVKNGAGDVETVMKGHFIVDKQVTERI